MIYLLIEENYINHYNCPRFIFASTDKEKVKSKEKEMLVITDLANSLLFNINKECLTWGIKNSYTRRIEREIELEKQHHLPGKIMELVNLTYTIEEVPDE